MRYRIIVVAGIALAGVVTSIAHAQSVSFVLARGDASRSLELQSGGFSASLVVPVSHRAGVALTFDQLTGDATATGIVCGDVIDPIQCPNESYTQNSRLTTAGAGVDFLLYQARYAGLSLRPQLLLGRAKNERLGHATGNTLSATKTEMGLSFGAEVRITPMHRLPLDLALGGALRTMWPTATQADGYTPFEERFTSGTIYAGVAFTRRREP
jgi:hypothetical protein